MPIFPLFFPFPFSCQPTTVTLTHQFWMRNFSNSGKEAGRNYNDIKHLTALRSRKHEACNGGLEMSLFLAA